ncbi:MAG: hypothetical protein HY563_07110 [Ignavibacteriales bacterium]|nr:hypothetical protein [Ignavibacteriales bacterium]
MRIAVYLALLVAFLACSEGGRLEPTEKESRLVRAYAEMILHREQFVRSSSWENVEMYRQQVDSILWKHGFMREEFIDSFESLVETPDRFDPLFRLLSSDLQQHSPR